MRVLASPGTPNSNAWPPEKMAVRMPSSTACWPTMRRATCASRSARAVARRSSSSTSPGDGDVEWGTGAGLGVMVIKVTSSYSQAPHKVALVDVCLRNFPQGRSFGAVPSPSLRYARLGIQRFLLAWAVGIAARFALVALFALVVAPRLRLALAPTLFALVGVLIGCVVVEALVVGARQRQAEVR